MIFNGKMGGSFLATRGLRQGDPLSPSLFILAEEVLSRVLNTFLAREDEFTTTIARCPSHLLFADDIILFICAKRRAVMKTMDIIKTYCLSSGRSLNPAKCNFYLPPKAPRERARSVMAATQFQRGNFPFVYLGVPVGPGKHYVRHFQHVIDRISERTNGWQARLLSSADRLVLIKHVLSSIPIHVLSATTLPEECVRKIESILAKIFWGSTNYGRRHHWCNWKRICLPVNEGGLGIRDLRDVRNAFIMKKC